jgi:excisionase family DNA binding protein
MAKAKRPPINERASPAPAAPAPSWTKGSDPIKLNFRDAARYLGISLSCLREKIRRGQLGVEVLGWRTRFVYVAELDAYMARRRSPNHMKVKIPKTPMSAFDPCI